MYGYVAVLNGAWALHRRFRWGLYGYVAVLGGAWTLHDRAALVVLSFLLFRFSFFSFSACATEFPKVSVTLLKQCR